MCRLEIATDSGFCVLIVRNMPLTITHLIENHEKKIKAGEKGVGKTDIFLEEQWDQNHGLVREYVARI